MAGLTDSWSGMTRVFPGTVPQLSAAVMSSTRNHLPFPKEAPLIPCLRTQARRRPVSWVGRKREGRAVTKVSPLPVPSHLEALGSLSPKNTPLVFRQGRGIHSSHMKLAEGLGSNCSSRRLSITRRCPAQIHPDICSDPGPSG